MFLQTGRRRHNKKYMFVICLHTHHYDDDYHCETCLRIYDSSSNRLDTRIGPNGKYSCTIFDWKWKNRKENISKMCFIQIRRCSFIKCVIRVCLWKRNMWIRIHNETEKYIREGKKCGVICGTNDTDVWCMHSYGYAWIKCIILI